jgi:hypothetical protein
MEARFRPGEHVSGGHRFSGAGSLKGRSAREQANREEDRESHLNVSFRDAPRP